MGKYVKKEVELGATLGPFQSNPLGTPLAISPINTVPKSDSAERRIIMNLSCPLGQSVNDGIVKGEFLGEPYKLKLSGVDDMIELINQKGPGCLLFKRDLSRAFCQFAVDPGDIDIELGFTWGGNIYIDRMLAMGLRSAEIACQKATDIIRYICGRNGVTVLNYLDDIGGAEVPHHAQDAFRYMGHLLSALGLDEPHSKACEPAVRMTFLGILFDTVSMVMEVTPERVQEISNEVEMWLVKQSTSKYELQVLLGKLHFITKCVHQGRIFVSRLLNLLRDISGDERVALSEEARADIRWFHTYLHEYNGVSLIPEASWSKPDERLDTDACLVGCGGVCGNEYFYADFPEQTREEAKHISALEMLTIVAAVKNWGERLTRAKVLVFCDNDATIQVINSGKTRDGFMQKCLRELCYITAKYQCVVRVVHLPGAQNRLPDLLSRWSLNLGAPSEFRKLTGHMDMRKKQIPDAFFFFSHPWWKVRPDLSTGHVSREYMYVCVQFWFGSWPNWSSEL